MRKWVIGVEEKHPSSETSVEEEARRQFLARCGRFAIVTPPATALLAAKPDKAMASTFPGKGKHKGHHKPKPKRPGLSGLVDEITDVLKD